MSRNAGSGVILIAVTLLGGGTGCSLVRNPQAIVRETRRDESTLAAFLAEAQGSPGRMRELEPPLRIGLGFLPPAGNIADTVPTAEQRAIALAGVRSALLSQSYLGEVVIIPDYYFGQAAGGFETLRGLSRRFDFDLLAVMSSGQTSYESRNFRSLGLVTVIGADLWEGDVDKAVTVIELAIVEPESRAVVMRAASAAAFGDTTTILDDWRSSDHVRRVSFDEARVALVDELTQKFGELRSRLESPTAPLH